MHDALTLYREEYDHSLRDPARFWAKEAEALDWFHPATSIMDVDTEEVDISWFSGARLNACHNCVDRHAAATPEKLAIHWVGNDPGHERRITYRQLKHEVARFANVLVDHGVRRGDRVCLYMPMIPEAAFAMLACARIGAVHSVVFAGFSADALRDRILDARAKVIITADELQRGSKTLQLKPVVDQAIEGLHVDAVIVAKHTGGPCHMHVRRDVWLHEEMARHRSTCPLEWMSAEDPLFVLYTSGSTGRPKGVLHTTGGYLVYANSTYRRVFGIRPDDVFFCTADVGWITGHTYLVYGPLSAGSTVVMYEGIPTWPEAARLWRVVDQTKATILYTAPTALRALMRGGDEPVRRTSRASLRLLGTVGEPINPQVWTWYHDVVGEGRCEVIDTWWQTETGGALISPIAGVTPARPGSATFPLPGVQPVLVDDDGCVLEGNGVSGNLCLKGSWPGQARTIYGDHRRFKEAYFSRFHGLYFTGDGARRDEDGFYWITGRVDDVLNVSGHRIGSAEVESALVAHPTVAEAAVVGRPHDIKGTAIRAYVHLRDAAEGRDHVQLVGELKEAVRHAIGAIAVPDDILIISGLPKTRSGKIMRRVLRKIAEGESHDLGDLSALADPHVVDELIAASAV